MEARAFQAYKTVCGKTRKQGRTWPFIEIARKPVCQEPGKWWGVTLSGSAWASVMSLQDSASSGPAGLLNFVLSQFLLQR